MSDASDLTRCLKLLAGAHGMNRRDVADVVTRGGVPCTASRADRWLRAPDAVKAGSGYARPFASASGLGSTRRTPRADTPADARRCPVLG
jgi:hypothetical protein